jgi:hypothetical protein
VGFNDKKKMKYHYTINRSVANSHVLIEEISSFMIEEIYYVIKKKTFTSPGISLRF